MTAQSFDRRDLAGPFDIIGDVHGCVEELEELLSKLGYVVGWSLVGGVRVPDISAAPDRTVVFVGDLVDRGPGSGDVVALVMRMCAAGLALCVPGNHDLKFRKWLDGHHVAITHGLQATIADFERVDAKRRATVSAFIRNLPPYLWLDSGRLVVAHAGIKADMIGHTSHKIENFCLYGDTDSGKTTSGLPIRYNWAARYDGAPLVVYGHVCVAEPAWVNGTVCVDTGCCFGGSLTALRYPERDTVSVSARRTYVAREGSFGLPPARA
jgi:diadenosine tetraphosphatase ApaH/serine/threonine PP2A family protein phosphatase